MKPSDKNFASSSSEITRLSDFLTTIDAGMSFILINVPFILDTQIFFRQNLSFVSKTLSLSCRKSKPLQKKCKSFCFIAPLTRHPEHREGVESRFISTNHSCSSLNFGCSFSRGLNFLISFSLHILRWGGIISGQADKMLLRSADENETCATRGLSSSKCRTFVYTQFSQHRVYTFDE